VGRFAHLEVAHFAVGFGFVFFVASVCAFGFCQSAWSTDPACGRLEAQQELVEDTRGTTTSRGLALANGQKRRSRIPLGSSPALSPPGVYTAPLVLLYRPMCSELENTNPLLV
jgi:hypothetical protein